MLELLQEFYKDRKTAFDSMLSFQDIGAFGGFRIQAIGSEIAEILPEPESEEKISSYRDEFKAFTNFLRQKFFKE